MIFYRTIKNNSFSLLTHHNFPFYISAHHRLAALEIAKFQDQLFKRLMEDMSAQMENLPPSTGAVMVSTQQQQLIPYDYDWTFARAFLYSLTVLTTIGKLNQNNISYNKLKNIIAQSYTFSKWH